jgi:hypothetical protein
MTGEGESASSEIIAFPVVILKSLRKDKLFKGSCPRDTYFRKFVPVSSF